MSNINILQNVVVDKHKIADLVRDMPKDDLKRLLGIKDSQVANLRNGDRRPSANGLLRLLMMHNIDPADLAGVEVNEAAV